MGDFQLPAVLHEYRQPAGSSVANIASSLLRLGRGECGPLVGNRLTSDMECINATGPHERHPVRAQALHLLPGRLAALRCRGAAPPAARAAPSGAAAGLSATQERPVQAACRQTFYHMQCCLAHGLDTLRHMAAGAVVHKHFAGKVTTELLSTCIRNDPREATPQIKQISETLPGGPSLQVCGRGIPP